MEPEPEPQDDVTKINYITARHETIDELFKVDIDEFKKNLEVRRKVHGKADYLVKNSLKQYHTILERAISNIAELFEEILEDCDLELDDPCLLLPPEDPNQDDPTNSDGLLITTTTTTTPNEINKVIFVQEENNNNNIVETFVEKCNMSKEEFKEYPLLNENDIEVVDNELPSCSKSIGGNKNKDQDKRDVFRILGFDFETTNSMIMSPTISANSTEQNQSQVINSVNLLSEIERKPATEVVEVDAIHPPKYHHRKKPKPKKLKPLPPPPLITRPLQLQQQQQQQHLANINNLQNVMNMSFGDNQPRPRSPNCEPSGPTWTHRKPKLDPPPMISR